MSAHPQELIPYMLNNLMHVQADQIHLIALKVQRKYYSEPSRDSQRPASLHAQLV